MQLYQVNDLVMYRNVGVCRIVDIAHREQFGTSGEYYTLKPLYDERSTIFVNVENKKVMMRYLMPAEKVKQLVDNIDEIDAYRCDNDRERDNHCRELINSGDAKNWIQVIKGLYDRKCKKNARGKDLSQQEQRLFKTAEKLFYGEVSCTLNIPFEKVSDYITQKMQSKLAAQM